MRCFSDGDNEERLRLVSRRYARSAVWSGRWDLNPRQLAWEARTLPLSYARSFRFVEHLYRNTSLVSSHRSFQHSGTGDRRMYLSVYRCHNAGLFFRN